MEKHIVVVHVDAPDKERNTRKFLMKLAFRNVREINTKEFTCLINNITEKIENITEQELNKAIDKFLELSAQEQDEILNKCCTFSEDNSCSFNLELSKFNRYSKEINNTTELDYIKEIKYLKTRLKYCKNHLEKQQLFREIQSLKKYSSKYKTKSKKRRK